MVQNENAWGVKKVQGQEESALISTKAKKCVNESVTLRPKKLADHLFTSKAHYSLQGVFSAMIGLAWATLLYHSLYTRIIKN